MPKKFFDIIPPKDIPEKENKLAIEKDNILFKKEVKKKGGKNLLPKAFIFISAIFIIGLFLFISFALSSIDIEIFPLKEPLEISSFLNVVSKEGPGNDGKSVLGVAFEKEKEETQLFASTGKATEEIKARGIIRVYNGYSTSSQSLLKGTRFVSAEGKMFKLTKAEIIPGAAQDKGKISPSYFDVEVEAAQAGEDYNIGPTTFSIPGFLGTAKYTSFYGKSFVQMNGGRIGEILQVTLEDLKNAQKSLAESLKKEIIESAISENPEIVFIAELSKYETGESVCSRKAKENASSFNCSLKIKLKTTVFKKEDVEKIVNDLISAEISKNRSFLDQSTKINYSIKQDSPDQGKTELIISAETETYINIDQKSLQSAVAGKTIKEAKVFLENYQGISKVKIKYWPFWLNAVPENKEKIEIRLNLFEG